jgi:glycosyltransferase involved in cell wall biosynthesis
MKLQILVPQYQETDEVIKPLLDSLSIQQNVDFSDIGVVICNDGTDVHLSESLLNSYPFAVEYHLEPHRGVSGTRNACLDYAKAEYVMFCDADDMFYNACGLYIIFREFEQGSFDSLVSAFVEETRDPVTKEPVYINHDMDMTFVHGKIHRRKFLLKQNIRWNEKLTIHEDSYFNCLCQKLAKELKYCQTPFYLWKWRDDSVCRHDPKYILKTYNNMLDSNTALVSELLKRGHKEDAQFYATNMIYDAYFTMNKAEWIDQENQQYRDATELRFKEYYLQFQSLYESIPQDVKTQIVMGIKNRMYGEGLLMEHITFDDWITKVLTLE